MDLRPPTSYAFTVLQTTKQLIYIENKILNSVEFLTTSTTKRRQMIEIGLDSTQVNETAVAGS